MLRLGYDDDHRGPAGDDVEYVYEYVDYEEYEELNGTVPARLIAFLTSFAVLTVVAMMVLAALAGIAWLVFWLFAVAPVSSS